jgi:hypothetical protein
MFDTSNIFLTFVELRNDIEAAMIALTCCKVKKQTWYPSKTADLYKCQYYTTIRALDSP